MQHKIKIFATKINGIILYHTSYAQSFTDQTLKSKPATYIPQ